MRRTSILFAALALLSLPTRADEPPPAPPDATDPGHDPGEPARPELRPNDLVKEPPKKQIDELLLRGVPSIPLEVLVDETVDDLVADLNKLDISRISPIAVRSVEVSPNLKSTFAKDLEHRIVAAIAQSTTIKQIECLQCRALRSRVENGEWVVSLGPTNRAELAALGRDLGVRAFLEVDFDYESGPNTIVTQARLVRAEDGVILWSEAYTSDSDTASLARGRERNQTRDQRRAELDRLIQGRPSYGYAVMAGILSVPWSNPNHDPLLGATGGFRFYEKFGYENRSLFGVDVSGFANITAPVFGGLVGVTYMYQFTPKSLLLPDIRVGGTAGAYIGGGNDAGDTIYGSAQVEMMLKFRVGIGAGILYMLPTQLQTYDFGGLGYQVRVMFVW